MKKIRNNVVFLLVFMMLLQFFSLNPSRFVAYSKNNELTSAKAMAVVEVNSGRLLYKKDEQKRLPMASTTKIITAIVAIENCKDLDEKHQIPKESVGIEGSSIYLRKNEHLSVRELLYGLMLRSGNDSAVAIAIIVAGSVENFVSLMNKFCEKLSLNNTHIVTVNGLHDENHYTSASDLAKATCYALKNPIFSKIVSTKSISVSDENSKDGTRLFVNKNKLLKMIDGADGVKTGYTKKAGKCFVGSATRGKMQVVCVVLDAQTMFDDSEKLINKAFNEYSMQKLFSKGVITEKEIKNGSKTSKIPVVLTRDIYYPLKKGEMKEVRANILFNDNLVAPISSSDEIGELSIMLKNDLIFSQKLFTISVEKIEEESVFRKIIKAF